MTDPVSPIGGPSAPRRVARGYGAEEPSSDEGSGAPDDGGSRLPAVIPQPTPAPAPSAKRSGIAAFAAQVIGQPGQKRGLRGGKETLDKARSTYLETEWSGPADRRHRTGKITKTEI